MEKSQNSSGSGQSTKESLFGDDEDLKSTFVSRNKDIFGDMQPLNMATSTLPSQPAPFLDKRTPSSRLSMKFSKVLSETEDPLSRVMLDSYDPVMRVTKENLTIRKDDEAKIVAGLHNAAKKQATGSIYSVVVDLGKTGTLGIGVKDLADKVLAVSMLKRENCCPGAGEDAGIRLGDVIYGVNFIPTREGSKTLISIIKKETGRGKTHIHIQGWRCHQLCTDPIPGYHFPRADEILVQAYSLVQSSVFSDWERWNFIEILLGHMLDDLKLRASGDDGDTSGLLEPSQGAARAKQMQVLDLERNIMQAKGLRTALCVRIVHTKSHGDTVVYVLRVEDVQSGLQWVVQRRYSDFFALNEELLDMTHFTKEVEFPRKRLSIRNTAKLVENRIVALEQYMRRMLHILTLYATMDASASRALRHLQTFLGVDNYLDCVHPPPLDDQRFIELMAYQFLNDFGSEACQQCVRFITSVDLDAMVEVGTTDGYVPVLNHARDALAEVEQFVQQLHMAQMIQTLQARREDLNEDQLRSFVRKCIRRQVEAALYLPLRRTVFRIVFSFLSEKSKLLQRAITMLQGAPPKFFMLDTFVTRATSLPRTVKAFRRVIQAYLPADQGQLLIQAATAVVELHKECQSEKNRLAALGTLSSIAENEGEASNNTSDPPVPRRLSDDVDMQYISIKTPDLDIGVLPSAAALASTDRAEGDMDLPPTPKKPVVTKLRELFTRKKTTEDLFNSSDSDDANDDDAVSVSSGSVYSTTTPTSLYHVNTTSSFSFSASASAPNSPVRNQTTTATTTTTTASSTAFIKRLIPRVSSGPRDLETADNLFIDEKKAFTVSVKSDISNATYENSGSCANSPKNGVTHPPISPRRPSSTSSSSSFDDDLSNIQKHIASLQVSSDTGGTSPVVRIGSGAGIAEIDRSVTFKTKNDDEVIQSPVLQHNQSLLKAMLERPAETQELSDLTGASTTEWTEQPSHSSVGSLSAPSTPPPTHGHDGDSTSSRTAAAATPGVFTRSLLEAMASNHVSVRESLSELHAPEDLKCIADAAGDVQVTTRASCCGSASEDIAHAEHGPGSDHHKGSGDANGSRTESKEGDEETINNLKNGSMVINNTAEEVSVQYDAISADDFLPLFTYVLIQAGLPQLLLVKELMTALVNDEDSYGECGYYLATLEAATQHILDLAEQYEQTHAQTQTQTHGSQQDSTDGAERGTEVFSPFES